MRRIRDVLRLKFAQGLSGRAIAASPGFGKGSVGAYPPYPPREVRECSGLRTELRRLRLQSNSAEAAQEGRNALRVSQRILGLGRLRLRGPCGVQDEFTLVATAQNLRKLAKLKPVMPVAG